MVYYHYTTGNGLLGILNSNTLHCSNINFLNDPSESKYINTILQEIFESNHRYKEIYDQLHQNDFIFFLQPQYLYIASFSRKRDSLHMWHYYADGNGYNIGIDIDAIIKLNEDKVGSIKKRDMIYESKEQKRLLVDLFTKYDKELLDINNLVFENEREEEITMIQKYNELSISFEFEIFNFEMTFKHPAYRHEEETRLIIGLYSDDIIKMNYFVSKTGVFVEYTSIALNLHSNLKSITVHPASNDLHSAGIKRYLKSKIDIFGDIPVHSSQVPFRVI